jgi:hypothetical protein
MTFSLISNGPQESGDGSLKINDQRGFDKLL